MKKFTFIFIALLIAAFISCDVTDFTKDEEPGTPGNGDVIPNENNNPPPPEERTAKYKLPSGYCFFTDYDFEMSSPEDIFENSKIEIRLKGNFYNTKRVDTYSDCQILMHKTTLLQTDIENPGPSDILILHNTLPSHIQKVGITYTTPTDYYYNILLSYDLSNISDLKFGVTYKVIAINILMEKCDDAGLAVSVPVIWNTDVYTDIFKYGNTNSDTSNTSGGSSSKSDGSSPPPATATNSNASGSSNSNSNTNTNGN